MSNLIYEGPVRVDDKKADGSPLIIGKGDRQGEPYYKVAFKVGEAWVNLMDFDGYTHGQKGDYHIEYYQKFLPNGEPDLYNGKPQYQLVSLLPLGAPAPQASTPQPQASVQGSYVPAPDTKTTDIRRAVAIKAATELTAAMLPHLTDAQSFAYIDRVLSDANRILYWLETGKETNELDQMLAAAKDALTDVIDPDDGIPF